MNMDMRRRPVAKAQMRYLRLAAFPLVAPLIATSLIVTAHAEGFIAGTTPDRRPEGAPKIEKFEKSPQWYEAATAGISKPLPPSLKFLENQGAWYTPFIRPGMTKPYDIRGLHAAAAQDAGEKSKPSN